MSKLSIAHKDTGHRSDPDDSQTYGSEISENWNPVSGTIPSSGSLANGPTHRTRLASESDGTSDTDTLESIMDVSRKRVKEDTLDPIDEEKLGLFNMRAMVFLLLWYFFSACTLFLNKYILATLHGDPTLLGTMQMVMTATLGFVQLYFPCGMYKPIKREGKPPNFWRNMILVGSTRFTTVFLGLVALKFVAVSFTETIKSSAPIFTVLIARLLLGERTGLFTQLSLIPIMSGLALCSAYELSFNIQGFIAALSTNLTECLQNVYSKMLISGEKHKYTAQSLPGKPPGSEGTRRPRRVSERHDYAQDGDPFRPAELQFYTSIASVVVQIPACYLLMDFDHTRSIMDLTMVASLLMNGCFFHFQSITAYVLMSYISPVTHSVANTVKRAFLIWLSVIIFGNPVTFLSGLGTIVVTFGVFAYNKARAHDETLLEKLENKKEHPVSRV